MSERYKNLATISIVIDPKSYEKYGEITGGFNDIELENHIKEFGHSDLLDTLAYMQWRVWQTVREFNSKEQEFSNVVAS